MAIIPVLPVRGFLGAGKTSLILESLRGGFFHKRGRTLILACEDGETQYVPELLAGYRASVAYFEGGDFTAFVTDAIRRVQPGRIFWEQNCMKPQSLEEIGDLVRVDPGITLVNARYLEGYLSGMRQLLQDMIAPSGQIIFRNCPKENLSPYASLFRVMNARASYLWEGPGGYHEKAFGVMVPYDLNASAISLTESDFVPFVLDAQAAPEHYDGKMITLFCRMAPDPFRPGGLVAGREVMTCCAADIRLLGFPCVFEDGVAPSPHTWGMLQARGIIRTDALRQRSLVLQAETFISAAPPERLVIGL